MSISADLLAEIFFHHLPFSVTFYAREHHWLDSQHWGPHIQAPHKLL